MIDARDWSVRGLVVDTRLWLPGGRVLVPSDAVGAIDRVSLSVRVELDRESLRELPSVSRPLRQASRCALRRATRARP